MKLYHLPYQRTTSILDNDIPVKSLMNGTVGLPRPCPLVASLPQEISSDAAAQLLELIDQEPEVLFSLSSLSLFLSLSRFDLAPGNDRESEGQAPCV
jgi:hypothetical protein